MKHVIIIETPDRDTEDKCIAEDGRTFQQDCIRSLELACSYYFNDNAFLQSRFFQDSAVDAAKDMALGADWRKTQC